MIEDTLAQVDAQKGKKQLSGILHTSSDTWRAGQYQATLVYRRENRADNGTNLDPS